MLLERIWNTCWCFRQVLCITAATTFFDSLNPLLDFTDVLDLLIETLTINRSQLAPQIRHLSRYPIEDASVCLAVC